LTEKTYATPLARKLGAKPGDELKRRFPVLKKALAPADGLWIAWPKKASKIDSDLDFATVQGVGLAAGLVDNKSAAIDEDWQAVRFVFRRADRPR
jgi:hypothetical protein